MERRRKLLAVLICVIIICSFLIWALYITFDPYSRLKNFGDTNGRYDSTQLEDMGLMFERKSDIMDFDNFRFHMRDNASVLATSPGLVTYVSNSGSMIYISICFNKTLKIDYIFFIGGADEEGEARYLEKQFERIWIQEGDWIQKGDVIASFVQANKSILAFSMLKQCPDVSIPYCPVGFMSEDARRVMEDVIQEYDPDYECYHSIGASNRE